MLPKESFYSVADMEATVRLIRKLNKSSDTGLAVSPQDKALLSRQVKRTREALSSLERALLETKPA